MCWYDFHVPNLNSILVPVGPTYGLIDLVWFPGDRAVPRLCPDVAVYWVNRGLCHFRRRDWARVEEESRRALALDHDLFKVTTTTLPRTISSPRYIHTDLYEVCG